MAEYFFAVFKKAGFEYYHAFNPTVNPVDLMLCQQPDLILSDVVMPVMDGFEMGKILKADGRTKDIPLVYLTNQNGQADIRAGLSLGAAAYLIKGECAPMKVVNEVKKSLGIEFSK